MAIPSPTDILDKVRSKHFDKWAKGYAKHLLEQARAPRVDGPRHLMFALCDHYEPLHGDVDDATGRARVKAWTDHYPTRHDPYRDADGHKPKHSYFFPGEQYQPQYLAPLADLAKAGWGEVELHLHHDNDTADNLRADILQSLANFGEHGHLTRDPDGRLRYAFIHGNWCLANARSDGRWCGVDEEIPLLWDTGCYADFTFPAVPDESQPNIVNQIYWPEGDLARRRAYEEGTRARVGETRDDRVLFIQGPLALARAPGRVRIETGDLHGGDPATAMRVRSWVRQNIHVQGRPEWVFVKVHTHGAPERNAEALLGASADAMHSTLTGEFNDGRDYVLHYVTAREMYNIAMAAMDGKTGNPNEFRDYRLPRPPAVG